MKVRVRFLKRYCAWFPGADPLIDSQRAELLIAAGFCELFDKPAPTVEPEKVVPTVEPDPTQTPAVEPVESQPAAEDDVPDANEGDGQDNDPSGESAGSKDAPADKPRRFRRGNRS